MLCICVFLWSFMCVLAKLSPTFLVNAEGDNLEPLPICGGCILLPHTLLVYNTVHACHFVFVSFCISKNANLYAFYRGTHQR